MTPPGQSNGRKLSVGVDQWEGANNLGERLVETRRTDTDEVQILIGGEDALYLSLAAAREVGTQLLERALEVLGS